MEDQIEIHAYHGWGFDANFWLPLKNKIDDRVLFKMADRGYFGGEFEPEYHPKTSIKIVLTHSFGLHWCPNEKLIEADYLIIFNGFTEFVPKDRDEKKKVMKSLRAMIQGFNSNPEIVLNAFYKNCTFPNKNEFLVSKWMNKSKLYKDLKSLRRSKFLYPKNQNLKIIVLNSGKDLIVNKMNSNDLKGLTNLDNYVCFNESGHALPHQHSEDSWSYLSSVIPILAPYANTGNIEK